MNKILLSIIIILALVIILLLFFVNEANLNKLEMEEANLMTGFIDDHFRDYDPNVCINASPSSISSSCSKFNINKSVINELKKAVNSNNLTVNDIFLLLNNSLQDRYITLLSDLLNRMINESYIIQTELSYFSDSYYLNQEKEGISLIGALNNIPLNGSLFGTFSIDKINMIDFEKLFCKNESYSKAFYGETSAFCQCDTKGYSLFFDDFFNISNIGCNACINNSFNVTLELTNINFCDYDCDRIAFFTYDNTIYGVNGNICEPIMDSTINSIISSEIFMVHEGLIKK